ncbi:hypothetical protein Tco_0917976 [Tanacetum coccineum]
MSEEDHAVGTTVLPKFDMPSYESIMTAKDVKSLALRHGIPLDLHPVALTKGWTMDKLPDDMIVSKQGHWFSFEKRLGKGVGGQIFRETFSGLKGWKKRFFFLERRVIPDAMAWRHHDSDVNNPVPEDGFNASDVHVLIERVADLRPIFKDTEGNVVTMSEYLHFPFLSGASISKGPSLTYQDQILQLTTRPLPSDQTIPEKTNHQKGVEVEDPKIVAIRERKAQAVAKKREKRRQGGDGGDGSRPATKRRKTIARKDGTAASEATSSPEPLRTINPTDPSSAVAETTESPIATQSASPPRSIRRAHIKEGESSRGGALYVIDWSIHKRCRLDTSMWCRELMVHLAPPGAQEESNALNNATALERAWFSLAQGALAQTDILKRFEHLQANFDRLAETHSECGETVRKLVQARLDLAHSSHLYTTLSNQCKIVKSEHEGCAGKLEVLESRNSELSQVNKDQALQIKELEDELARKDFALVYAERLNVERAQEKEKLVAQLRKRRWKRLSEERSEEDLLEIMGRMENFDVYADKKMRVEYDKVFEKRYPYVEKISRGFQHSISNLLKVYPDSPPFGQAPPSKPSSGKAASTYAP